MRQSPPNRHISSLDCQRHGKNATKPSRIAIHARWIASATETTCRHTCPPQRRMRMDSPRDREAPPRRRRERHRLQRERETAEEREARLAKKRTLQTPKSYPNNAKPPHSREEQPTAPTPKQPDEPAQSSSLRRKSGDCQQGRPPMKTQPAAKPPFPQPREPSPPAMHNPRTGPDQRTHTKYRPSWSGPCFISRVIFYRPTP